MEKIIKEEEDAGTIYEVSYLFLPSIAEEQVSTKADSLKETLVSADAEIISFELPVLIDLAYSMTKVVQTVRHKVTSGYFGWIKFELSQENIAGVKRALDANPDILRYLIVKTVRENTLLNGKMIFKKEEVKKLESDEDVSEEVLEAVKEVTSEELDKSIDDLVVV